MWASPTRRPSARAGGRNGTQLRAWKVHLQALTDGFRMAGSVCHCPPGTSEWNKVEHRLFSFMSMNWRGRLLLSYETVINLIGGTTTIERAAGEGFARHPRIRTRPEDHGRRDAHGKTEAPQIPRRLELHLAASSRAVILVLVDLCERSGKRRINRRESPRLLQASPKRSCDLSKRI